MHVERGIVAFASNTSNFGCPLPCSNTFYKTRVNYFDEFNEPHLNSSIKMHTYYDTMVVEQQNEILVYDWSRFLSALGGTLGLYLGFSCFTMINGLIDLSKTFIDSKMSVNAKDSDATVKRWQRNKVCVRPAPPNRQ